MRLLGFLHGRLSFVAAFLVALLTLFGAHAAECTSLGHHAATIGRAADRSGQALAHDAAEFLPAVAASSQWSGDDAGPSKNAPVVAQAEPASVCDSVIRDVVAGRVERIDTSNSALAHKAVTVLLI